MVARGKSFQKVWLWKGSRREFFQKLFCILTIVNKSTYVLKLVELHTSEQTNQQAEVINTQTVSLPNYFTTFCCHLCSWVYVCLLYLYYTCIEKIIYNGDTVHLFAFDFHCWLGISHSGRIYTVEIGSCCKSGLVFWGFFGGAIAEDLPAHITAHSPFQVTGYAFNGMLEFWGIIWTYRISTFVFDEDFQ